MQGEEAHKLFKSLFEKYYGSLVSYGISLTGNMEAAREIVQEVFLKLWENKDKIRINESLKSYLFKSVFNRAANWIRHEKVKQAFEKDSFREVFNDLSVPFDTNPFLELAINNAIEKLPDRAGEAFSLRYLDGFSQKNIAEKMNISEKTVENQIQRAKKILRKNLRSYR